MLSFRCVPLFHGPITDSAHRRYPSALEKYCCKTCKQVVKKCYDGNHQSYQTKNILTELIESRHLSYFAYFALLALLALLTLLACLLALLACFACLLGLQSSTLDSLASQPRSLNLQSLRNLEQFTKHLSRVLYPLPSHPTPPFFLFYLPNLFHTSLKRRQNPKKKKRIAPKKSSQPNTSKATTKTQSAKKKTKYITLSKAHAHYTTTTRAHEKHEKQSKHRQTDRQTERSSEPRTAYRTTSLLTGQPAPNLEELKRPRQNWWWLRMRGWNSMGSLNDEIEPSKQTNKRTNKQTKEPNHITSHHIKSRIQHPITTTFTTTPPQHHHHHHQLPPTKRKEKNKTSREEDLQGKMLLGLTYTYIHHSDIIGIKQPTTVKVLTSFDRIHFVFLYDHDHHHDLKRLIKVKNANMNVKVLHAFLFDPSQLSYESENLTLRLQCQSN
ncbi:hypothetical protein EYC84_010131 [Monilinia fructicola]|uniref:Uncharacterized protein n=1 Tax=Monilinia fructicola TaxID=38448 RepID=A0A5M9JCQ2_MONFR|nr:hypothetical protein EYC84_010131 [Monilinia fructicola]